MKQIVNYKVVRGEDLSQVFISEVTFIGMAKDCNHDVKIFHKTVVMKAITEGVFISDWDVKRFVYQLVDMPFDYEEMSKEQLNFLRDLYKRYFNSPIKHSIEDYMNEMKQMKNN
jgi:hypothetical protein